MQRLVETADPALRGQNQKIDFENTKLPIPKEYDKYLKYLYGDYMEMIPVSERHVSHDIKQIDLGEYAGYICNGSFANSKK